MKEQAMEKLQYLLNTCELEFSAEEFLTKMVLFGFGFGFGLALIFFNYSMEFFVWTFFGVFLVFEAMIYSLLIVTVNSKIALIEEILPDFLNIVASNIRSGFTHDRALLLSAKNEFGPLTKEINRAAKELVAGKQLTDALIDMTGRIKSETFSKTMRLIVQGLNSGGNFAELLESTALDIRRFGAIRKEIAATVMVYQLFLFGAAAIGAPLLYGVANFLIKIVANMRERIGTQITPEAGTYLPFFKQGVSISPGTVFLFSIIAIIVTAFFSSLAGGVISKGKESEGLQYVPILVAVSLGLFFAIGFLLENLITGITA